MNNLLLHPFLRLMLWLGLAGPGCGLAQQFRLPPPTHQLTQPPGINLMADYLSPDRRGHLWLPTVSGLARFDGRQFTVFHAPWQPQDDAYDRPIPTPDGRVWVRQYTAGSSGTLACFDPARQRLVRVSDTTRLVRHFLARHEFRCLYADRQGQLWIALLNHGLLRVNLQTMAADPIVTLPLQVRDLVEGPDGRIWFTTSRGLYGLDPQTRQTRPYRLSGDLAARLDTTQLKAIQVRANGDLLISLFNNVLLLTPATGQLRHIPLPPPTLTSRLWTEAFVADEPGNHYFSVGRMVFRLTAGGELQRLEFTHPTEKVISIGLTPGRGRLPPQLWVNTIGRTLCAYDLTRLRPLPPFNILDVSINGTTLAENEQHIDGRFVRDTTGQASLTVQENDFVRIRFTPTAELRQVHFRHKLDGYDQQWTVYRDAAGQVTYQLRAGTYAFLFNQARPEGNWSPQMARLLIRVQPPYYKTGWFLTGMVGLTLAGLGGLYRLVQRRQALRRALARQEGEANALRQLDELKGRFFANVTHELRTPLTLLLNANEQLTHQPLDAQGHKQIATINRNADQLLRLITQLLDMARLDAGKLDLRLSLGDPVAFMAQLARSFDELAATRRIDLSVRADEAGPQYLFDKEKLEAIFHNLLSNALKFTPESGTVRVHICMTETHQLVLTVQDTGPGIPPAERSRIFERFYQVDSSSTRAHGGTGIGLAFVRELTELMGGRIEVAGVLTEGSTFTVTLPLEMAGGPATLIDVVPYPVVRPGSPSLPARSAPVADTKRPVVLVVEDNPELRSYLADQLAERYQVVTAVDGQAGLHQALTLIPDLIVSDVMMPNMDGFALVGTLKTDVRTSHIPIILLTSRSSHDSVLHGLDMGADGYVGKPFKIDELKLQIRNAIQTRRNWQTALANTVGQTVPGQPPTDPMPDKEKRFLARLTHILRQHLQDEQIDVDWLATQANMSRSQLHRKLAALTGQTTTGFMHSVRLEKANELLQAGGVNVGEAAYQVGYNSPSYFTRLFQEQFGYLPTSIKQ